MRLEIVIDEKEKVAEIWLGTPYMRLLQKNQDKVDNLRKELFNLFDLKSIFYCPGDTNLPYHC